MSSEILFSRESLEEDEYGLTGHNYVRAKIYTKAGVERSNLLHIESPEWMKVRDVAARVLKPDGRIVDVAKTDFQESITLKEKNGNNVKQIAFAFPNLAPGDVVEYQWKTNSEEWVRFWRFCQEEIPVREFKFELAADNGAVLTWQNCTHAEPTGAGTDKIGLTVRDLPPFKTEPYMPPEHDLRGSVRLVYTEGEGESVQQGWQKSGTSEARWFSDMTKASSAVTKKAMELIAGAQMDDEKLRRLHTYCQNEIVNLDWADAPDLVREREKLNAAKGFQSPKEVIARGHALSLEIYYLFAALTRAAKFQVFSARYADNDDMRVVGQRGGFGYLDDFCAAVKVGAEYRYFDPAFPGVAYGMNHRHAEGSRAFICDSEKSVWDVIPESGPEKSVVERRGRFTLAEDGTLSGEVVETFTGHEAEISKGQNCRTPQAELEKSLSDSIRARLPAAEITEAKWENLRGTTTPVVRRYRLQVPDYAQKAGTRLILPVGYFKAGGSPWFPNAERQYPIVFPYQWSEHDDIEIVIPEGYALDHPSAPANVATANDPIHCSYDIGYLGKRHTLKYDRRFVLGRTFFQATDYPWIKRTFDGLSRSDSHSLMLRPKATAPTAGPAAASTAASSVSP